MKLVRLEAIDVDHYVNPDHVVEVYQSWSGSTIVVTSLAIGLETYELEVSENVHDVVAALTGRRR